MNTTQISEITKNFLGKVQEKTGKILGNKEQQMTGIQKQDMAKTQLSLGNARELIKNSIKQMHRSKRAMNTHRLAVHNS